MIITATDGNLLLYCLDIYSNHSMTRQLRVTNTHTFAKAIHEDYVPGLVVAACLITSIHKLCTHGMLAMFSFL